MARRKADERPPGREEDERALWAHVTRDTRPLPRRAGVAKASPRGLAATGAESARAEAPPPPQPAPASLARPKPLPELTLSAAPGLDARSAERLRRGELALEGRLDLHGHSQEEAHRALIAFIERAWRARRRALLVITGKGRERAGEGVLQAALPRWLNEAPLRARVLAFARARPKDGGEGALYVLLRRQR